MTPQPQPRPIYPRLFLRGHVFWGWFFEGKKRKFFSTGVHDYETALKILDAKERQVLGEAPPPEPEKAVVPFHTVKDALDYLLRHGCQDCTKATVDAYRSTAARLEGMLGTYNVNVLTAPMLRTYAQHRMFPVPGLDGVITTGIGKETLRKEFVTLTRALALAKERGLFTLDLDIVPKVRVKYVPRQRTISEESFRKLLGQLPAKRLPWVALAIFAGGKASEIEDVQWTDLDFPRARIALPGRTLPLAEPLRKLLEPLRRDPDTGKLLEGRVVEPWTNQRRDLAEAARSVGIPALSPNDLRKTFAVWLREGGEDSRTVAGMMGHSSTRMIDLVGQELRAAGFRSAVAKLPKRAL